MFEAVGAYTAGTMSEEEVREYECKACPTCGSCSGMYTANSMNCLTEEMCIRDRIYTYEKDGEEKTFTLAVGNTGEDGTTYYTRTADSKYVNEIDKTTLDKCMTGDTGGEEEKRIMKKR